MNKILCINKIAKCGLELLNENYQVVTENNPDAILVRSSVINEESLTKELLCIARAGAGVNNIPVDKCSEKGIVVFNTPGANANGVKELVIASLFLGSRDIIEGVNWVKTLTNNVSECVEKGKKEFAGKEIISKKLGVIGLGAIGVLVANSALSLGMTVYGYDTSLSVEHAIELKNRIIITKSLDEIYKECDYITIHVPLLETTKHMINETSLSKMKDGVVILNFSRDKLVNDDDLKVFIDNKKVYRYITDFPNEKTKDMKGVIAIPHLGASTSESEDNCAVMAVKQMMKYIECGIIENSVNYPSVDPGMISGCNRITILHKNVPNMIGQFTNVLGSKNINITNMLNKSKGEYAYTVIDTDSDTTHIICELEKVSNVFKVRVLK